MTRDRKLANSDLTQVIAEFIQKCTFLSCKICRLCRHLRLSKEASLRFLHEKLEFKKFHLRWVPDQLILNMKASRVVMPYELLEIFQHCQATDFVNLLTGDESWFFLKYSHYSTISGPRHETTDRKRRWQQLRLENAWSRSFDNFWNPQSTCIDQRYEIQIQFSVLPSTCYSGYPAKYLLIE
jgi:hypothetical protein